MSDEEIPFNPELDSRVYLARIARELTMIRRLTSTMVNHLVQAESEVPEKMRRFITYMHDIHDVSYMYEERGHQVPAWILREMERCDDRYRQLLDELHLDGGTFEKVRREMASDPNNRWDHTRQLAKPKEQVNETRQSEQQRSGLTESGANGASSESFRRV